MTENRGITPTQFVFIGILSMISNIQVINVYPNSSINIWFAAIEGAVASIPILLMTARLSGLFPEDDIFGIAEKTLGRIPGKIVVIIYTVYGLYLGIITIRFLTEFIQIASMNQTPQIVFLLFFGCLSGYIIYKGPIILGKLSAVVLPVVLGIFVLIILTSLDLYDYSYLRPGLEESVRSFADGAFSVASFSFCEVIFLLGFMKSVKTTQKKKYGIILLTLLVSTVYTVLLLISDLLVLGSPTNSILYFPHYEAVSIINLADFITHIEVISIISLLMCTVVKESICLYAVTEGAMKLTGLKKRTPITVIATASVIVGGLMIFDNTMDMYKFHSVNKFIVLALQGILPLFIYSIGEIGNILSKRRKTKPENKLPKGSKI